MQRLDFNTGWHFSCPDGRDFDVTLPHDAMLNTTRNTEPGFTWFLLAGWRGNDYTYTKNLHITSELINKHLVLEFEGVYCMTTVTVNDRPAAEKAYGYTPFTVELDGLLHEGDNTIEVTAHVPQDGHNRWYTGGGIYRPVHLLVGEDAYMQRYGVRVTTLSVAPACVRVEVMTHGGDCAEVRIAEKNGKEVVCAKAAVADGRAVVELEIPDAKLWNAEHPNLCLAEVTLYSGGKAVDTVTESFGLRVIEIDPARGLLINGEPTFLRGGCIHNDMGVIGVINNDATELHRARNIKKAGFNAIRSAHHPMSRSLMKACDEVGLYVMDEAFDYWYRMKSPNSPYNRYFMQDFKVDTAAMVQDAYNHPSVVIYSIGNEIPEAGGVKGVRVGKEIVDAIHALDTTRPTTLCPSVHWLREYLDGTPYQTTDEDEWMRDDPERQKSDWMHYASIFRSAVNNLPDNEGRFTRKPTSAWMKMPQKTFTLIWILPGITTMRIGMRCCTNSTRNVYCWVPKPAIPCCRIR